MKVVSFDRYGSADVLRVLDDQPVPDPSPGELLVRVHASSVNPIDCAVRSGYGKAFFETYTKAKLPMRPGRDVAGEVVRLGEGVKDFRIGDEVYAATLGGANADYVVVPESWTAPKPSSLDFAAAASLPYVALTSWTALVSKAGLSKENARGKRVLIPRAAGGVGCFATQLVKAWGGYVAALCSTRNVTLVRDLGADLVIDYKTTNPQPLLHDFDIAFDTSFDTEQLLLDALKTGAGATYVSIVTPKLRFVDESGLEEGVRRGDAWLADRVASQSALGREYHWAFTQPSGAALRVIANLIDAGRIRPVVDRRYTLDEIVAAHQYCESGLAQGKIVIDIARS